MGDREEESKSSHDESVLSLLMSPGSLLSLPNSLTRSQNSCELPQGCVRCRRRDTWRHTGAKCHRATRLRTCTNRREIHRGTHRGTHVYTQAHTHTQRCTQRRIGTQRHTRRHTQRHTHRNTRIQRTRSTRGTLLPQGLCIAASDCPSLCVLFWT